VSPEQFARVQQLFQAGCALPAEDRAAFVARSCPDDDVVRSKVERMLARHAREESRTGGGFLEAAAATQAFLGVAVEELDRRLADEFARGGRYRLLELLGEGGFGSVWRAEQRVPVRRAVALKVVKAGMDTRSVLARFEAERQTLARMSHPGIATVFDAGVTELGRPWFAMELAEGVPLTTYCDRERLDLRARLELFLRVCSAVQHAHQKGILHRDLKPSNVLVAALDGTPAPKVIDFGIAKALGPEADGEALTAERQFVGTPEYASPEQAAGERDLDTRTDIYSLGALLYELAVGLTPLDRSRAGQEGLIGVLELIRRTDPAPPSTRIGALGARAAEIAHRRRTDPAGLRRKLRGDLDWIAMKALERDPARRYATVEALADDLRRHLRNEPVEARAPSTLYRFQKFARRNRGLLGAAALAMLLLVGGTVGTGLGLLRALEARTAEAEANRALERTNAELSEERARLVDTNRSLAEKSAESEARRREAEETRNDVLRLSALQDLEDLLAAAEELWPAHPERVLDLQRWIDEARALVADLPRHEAQRAELRARALPQSEEERAADRAGHPRAAYHATLVRALAETPHLTAEKVAAAKAEIASLESELAQRRDWRFPPSEPQGRWWNNQLTKLIEGLGELERGLLAEDGVTPGHGWSVPKRLAFARTLEERTLTGAEARARWEEACASIRDRDECPAYDGLRIAPQLGLLPVGLDVDTGLWEFAHLETGEPVERDLEGRLVVKAESGLVFVLLPGGTFRMGAQSADPLGENHDPLANAKERVHEVELTPFFLSKFEMTQGQWLRFTGHDPNQYGASNFNSRWSRSGRGATLRQPVEQVTWRDCFRTLARMGLVLPTEAQWEYGARGGTGTIFWTGDDVASLQGAENLSDAYGHTHGNESWPRWEAALDDGQSVHAEVGTFRANPFGLHDVLGNVREWCLDGYYHDFYANSPREDPFVDPEISDTRIHRGGGYADIGSFARSSFRSWGTPDLSRNDLGCRPARALKE
jgi:serine/threonine protein kinase/formylglycine-generating enzyme required for sulfatase activity